MSILSLRETIAHKQSQAISKSSVTHSYQENPVLKIHYEKALGQCLLTLNIFEVCQWSTMAYDMYKV